MVGPTPPGSADARTTRRGRRQMRGARPIPRRRRRRSSPSPAPRGGGRRRSWCGGTSLLLLSRARATGGRSNRERRGWTRGSGPRPRGEKVGAVHRHGEVESVGGRSGAWGRGGARLVPDGLAIVADASGWMFLALASARGGRTPRREPAPSPHGRRARRRWRILPAPPRDADDDCESREASARATCAGSTRRWRVCGVVRVHGVADGVVSDMTFDPRRAPGGTGA